MIQISVKDAIWLIEKKEFSLSNTKTDTHNGIVANEYESKGILSEFNVIIQANIDGTSTAFMLFE